MINSRIDWTDDSFNPISGCLHGCEYCYARDIAHRFDGGKKLKYGTRIVLDEPVIIDGKIAAYPYGFTPTFHRYRLNGYIGKKGRNIFVCSMADLFGKWVPDEWIKEVFAACEKAPQHNYLFLTKNPQRYVELQDKKILAKMDNMWYGTSVTDEKSLKVAAGAFGDMKIGINTFFSIEPILEDITNSETWSDCVKSQYMDWVIIGAETGRRKDKVVPERKWIEDIADECKRNGIPLFMKSSLADIWGEPMIQEFPEGLKGRD